MIKKEGDRLFKENLEKWSSTSYAIFNTRRILNQIVREDIPSDIECPYPINEEEVVITDILGSGIEGLIYRVNFRTGDIKWEKEINCPTGIDYDYDAGRLAVGSKNGLYILDVETGETLKHITTVGGNDLTDELIYACQFLPKSPDIIYFSISSQHIVYRYDLSTNSYTDSFGEWGNPGSDLSHLYRPIGVGVRYDGDYVFIGDEKNHRFLRLDSGLDNVQDLALVPWAGCIRQMGWGCKVGSYLNPLIMTPEKEVYDFSFSVGLERNLLWILPTKIDQQRFNRDLDAMWASYKFARRFDLKNLYGRYLRSRQSYPLVNNETVDTGGYTSPPIPGILLGKAAVNTYSDQAGDLYIDVPNETSQYKHWAGTGLGVPTDYSWIEYHSESVNANQMLKLALDNTPPLFRVRFSPDAEATVTLTLYPR